jgi:hypothetical protein
MTGEVSVSPYPSRIGMPMSSKNWITFKVVAAPPEPMYCRRPPRASLTFAKTTCALGERRGREGRHLVSQLVFELEPRGDREAVLRLVVPLSRHGQGRVEDFLAQRRGGADLRMDTVVDLSPGQRRGEWRGGEGREAHSIEESGH